MEVLAEDVWRAREAAHHARVDDLVTGHLRRRERGEKHPIEDFLWVYYNHRPGQLRRWHPGAGVVLLGDTDPRGRLSWKHYRPADDPAYGQGSVVDTDAFLAARGDALTRWLGILEATAGRAGTFACFGLHEWAMVYGQREGERRHEQLPLRLGQAQTDAVLEAATIRCSHFDAYRFFTPAAAPRNELRPTRETQAEHEQPGCLHATMDLYKVAYQLTPAISSELVLDALDLALTARTLDMQASPYDVSGFGLPPVPIETAAGRADYVQRQRSIAREGATIRSRLVNACRALLTCA